QDKAAELRRRMSADKAAAIVSRLEDPSDSGDLSQQSHEEWLFLNRNSLEKSLLREVEEALLRVREGVYGICQECEEPISPKRLQALPWAKSCVRPNSEAQPSRSMRTSARISKRSSPVPGNHGIRPPGISAGLKPYHRRRAQPPSFQENSRSHRRLVLRGSGPSALLLTHRQ